ncbi:hypothetical protein CoNPh26_CDS0130 [Staphylococcus phage S-CoN_Ph26]|nr:hypothetical protein CoNPh26_CDS0130 [Staphylococcus phage S-CoN_Ph26]
MALKTFNRSIGQSFLGGIKTAVQTGKGMAKIAKSHWR